MEITSQKFISELLKRDRRIRQDIGNKAIGKIYLDFKNDDIKVYDDRYTFMASYNLLFARIEKIEEIINAL